MDTRILLSVLSHSITLGPMSQEHRRHQDCCVLLGVGILSMIGCKQMKS